jgi:hypothetical protein
LAGVAIAIVPPDEDELELVLVELELVLDELLLDPHAATVMAPARAATLQISRLYLIPMYVSSPRWKG